MTTYNWTNGQQEYKIVTRKVTNLDRRQVMRTARRIFQATSCTWANAVSRAWKTIKDGLTSKVAVNCTVTVEHQDAKAVVEFYNTNAAGLRNARLTD